jgi:hypothetical protein
MQSFLHAEASVRKFGGSVADYLPIHEFIDESKKWVGDVRHRAMRHHTAGPWMAQEKFGVAIEIHNEDGTPILNKHGRPKRVIVRDIAENHIVEDLGWIPSPADWLSCMECKTWMGGKRNKVMSRAGVARKFAESQKENNA